MRLKVLLLPIIAMVCMAPACSDGDLETLATNLNRAATALGTVQDTVIAAHDDGMFSDDVDDQGVVTQTAKQKADVIVSITVRVARAIDIANELTRDFSTMPEGGRDQLLEILVPVAEALEEGLTDSNMGLITNAGTRSAIELGFRTALLALQGAQALLEANN